MHPYPAKPVRVVHLSGTDYEMGKQHAEALGDDVKLGMAKFFFEFYQRMFQQHSGSTLESAALHGLKFLIDPVLMGRLVKQTPQFAFERLRGLSAVSHIPYQELVRTLVLPDLFPILQAYMARMIPNRFVTVRPPPKFGCSSFVSRGKRFLHGRNLDFPGVSYWDRYPVIQSIRRNGAIPYIGFSTAGVPFGGITGINEERISVSLHQHYCLKTSLRGKLPIVIAEEILSRARTLGEAIDILRDVRVAASWAFVLTDGKNREAAIFECHPTVYGITRLDPESPVIAHSNFFQTPQCRELEYATTARMNWDNYFRRQRLMELVGETNSELDETRAVKIISDHYDPFWKEEKIINRTVSQVYNIKSLVLDPENLKVWFAAGDSPIQIRDYYEYDLGEIFSGREGSTGRKLEGFRFSRTAQQSAKEKYIVSFVAAFDGDFEKAREILHESLEHEFCPDAGLVMAILFLKTREYASAQNWLEKSRVTIEAKVKQLGRKTFPPEYFEICLFQARTHDLKGERSKATEIYRKLAKEEHLEDTNLRRLAETGGPYSEKKLDRILMPYSTYIPFE